MDAQFKKSVRTVLERIGADITALVGIQVSFHKQKVRVVEEDEVGDVFRGAVHCALTRRMDSASSLAGFVVPERLAIELGATLMMLPGDAAEMTEEVELAFDEVLNVIIGAWKAAAPRPEDRLSNEVSERSRERYDSAGLEEMLASQGLVLVELPAQFDDRQVAFGFFAPPSWILGDKDSGATEAATSGPSTVTLPAHELEPPALAPSDSGSTKRDDAGGSARSRESGSDKKRSEPDGTVLIVDVSGELAAWITQRMQEGTLKVYRPAEGLPELDERATVVVVGPNPEVFRTLKVRHAVVTRRGEAGRAEPSDPPS